MTRRTTQKRVAPSGVIIPHHSLDDAVRVPAAIHGSFARGTASKENVARFLGYSPQGTFRSLLKSAGAYGLVQVQGDLIAVTDLGRRIVAPINAKDRTDALREAATHPPAFRHFLTASDGHSIRKDLATLDRLIMLGIPANAADRTFQILVENGRAASIITESLGSYFIDLSRSKDAEDLNNKRSRSDESFDRVESPPAPIRIPPKPPSPGGLQRDLRVHNYVLEKRLGIGFSAEVWSAIVADVPPGVELAQGASVAIKFFQPHFLMVPDQVIRIEREYRLASALRHPNLIRIYEFMLASSRPHHNFIVMDVARGESLRNVIPRTGMSPTKVIQIAKQLLTALDALHAAGALHRDVKPGNIAVADDDKGLQTTLLDLGIVSLTHEKNLTVSSRFLGSKHWAPYEQLIGQPLDARADLYSVGAVVYNMLTGIEPYANQHTEAAVAVTMRDHAIEIPPVMAPALTDLFNRCLSTNRDHRPSNASECLAIIDAKS